MASSDTTSEALKTYHPLILKGSEWTEVLASLMGQVSQAYDAGKHNQALVDICTTITTDLHSLGVLSDEASNLTLQYLDLLEPVHG